MQIPGYSGKNSGLWVYDDGLRADQMSLVNKINYFLRRVKTMKKNAVKGSLGAIALASAMTMSMGTPVFALQLPNVPNEYSTEIGGRKNNNI